MMAKKEELTFEEALGKLEKIVQKLEEGKAPLSESMELFEEGVGLARFCSRKLDEAKRKIEVLTGKDGKFTKEPFEIDTDEAGTDEK